MKLRSVVCDVAGCKERHDEKHYNAGFPQWGHVQGVMSEYGDTTAYLCPTHLQEVKNFLNGDSAINKK